MGEMFAASEIVEMGIQIEQNGRDFYTEMISKSKAPKAKDMFKYLADAEEEHVKVFRGILGKVAKYEPAESFPGEYFAYMRALASDYVFTQKDKGKELAKKVGSDLEAIDLGIQAEKDAILFYGAMKKSVPPNEGGIIDQLIAQEQAHLSQLVGFKKNL